METRIQFAHVLRGLVSLCANAGVCLWLVPLGGVLCVCRCVVKIVLLGIIPTVRITRTSVNLTLVNPTVMTNYVAWSRA